MSDLNKIRTFFPNAISLKTIAGESEAIITETSAPWNKTTLPTLFSNYNLNDIINANEFGLFYQCLSYKPSTSQQKNVTVVKKVK